MIEIKHVVKKFGSVTAVSDCSLTIQSGHIFGLLGTNGAGKSTLLRMISGVMLPDSGGIHVDGETVYDRPDTKQKIFFIPSELYFFPGSTMTDMGQYYQMLYPKFDRLRYEQLLRSFRLLGDRCISEFSKGMKRQAAILLGLCANTDYLIMDETFDGLDAVVRQAFKSLLAQEMEQRGLTTILASHNLREIEDICDQVGLLHDGGILLEENMDAMKMGIQKVQCVFSNEEDAMDTIRSMKVIGTEKRGRLFTFTIRGTREEVETAFRGKEMIFFEILPLTLEEIFISETENVGYDIRKLIAR